MRAACLITATLSLLLSGCIHIDVFHPDVQGTVHIGGDRPFWTYDGPTCHIAVAPIEPCPQETTSWCWAAAAQMLLQSQGVQMSQSEIVERAYGDTRNSGGKGPLVAGVLTGQFTRLDGSRVRLVAHRADGFPQNGLELLTSIEDGRPFMVDVGYLHDGHDFVVHSLLAYGLTYRREGNFVRILSLDVLDPSFQFMRTVIPDYDAHQSIAVADFGLIQGTLGIYRQ